MQKLTTAAENREKVLSAIKVRGPSRANDIKDDVGLTINSTRNALSCLRDLDKVRHTNGQWIEVVETINPMSAKWV